MPSWFGIFEWLSHESNADTQSTMTTQCMVNPASGLPMADSNFGIDIVGNPYGVDLHSGIGDAPDCTSLNPLEF